LDNNETSDNAMTKDKTSDTADTNLWPAIDIKSWDKTPAINGRVANEDDVKKGLAIYFIKNNGVDHSAYKIELPKLAYLTDADTKKEELVVVIQVECTPQDTVAGYRNIDGGNGACMLYELNFLDNEKIKNIVGH